MRLVSWNGGGYRLDHLIVSDEVEVPACEYAHAWREEGLSDHSGLVAELRLEGDPRPASAGRERRRGNATRRAGR